ncbi:hypothetical protein PRIPAC_81389, partial [Pristionchus pacificus]|uniref:G protein-coupled receptor n=1 Tax=Pristionchus pacificus TaxID=54126 RepID=A0A2A6C4Q4_PRIPA
MTMQAFEAIGLFIVFYSSWTLFIYISVISAMIQERKQSNIVFYTIYVAGSVADILALINGVFTHCSLTNFIHFTFLRTSLALKLSHIIVWGSRFTQLLTVLLIAINRLTAIHCRLRHTFVWTKQAAQVCASFQIALMFLYGTIVTHVLQPEWTHSSFGGVVAKVIGITSSDYETLVQFSIRTEDIMFSVSLLIQFVMSLAIIICYVAMLFELRSTMRKISILTLVQHIVTAQFCNLTVAFCDTYSLSTKCSFQNETKTSLYILLTLVYNSIPPYLLITFSKSIRHRILS